MATNYYNIKGKIRWAKLYEPDTYANATRWKLDFYPFDENEWAKVKKSGIAVKERVDKEGGKFINLRRMTTKFFQKSGEVVVFNPPAIHGAFDVYYVDQNGNKIESYTKGGEVKEVKRIGEPIEIGNDSVAVINLCTFDAGELKGHRFNSLQILDLVEFSRDKEIKEEDFVGEEQLEEVPVVVETPKSVGVVVKPDKTLSEDLNDSLDSVLPW